MSTREQIIQAVTTACGRVLGLTVARNVDIPIDVPSDGYAVVRDGELEQLEVMLGGSGYEWRAHVSIEIYATGDARDSAIDSAMNSIRTEIEGDATLAALALGIRTRLGEVETVSSDGAETIKQALLTAEVDYFTSTSLG